MTHSHAHSHSLSGPSPFAPLVAKVVVGLLIAIGVVTLAGAAWLWPSQQKVDIPLPFQNAAGGAVTTEAGHVVSTAAATCGYQSVGAVLTAPPTQAQGDHNCVQAFIAIDSGPNQGANTLLEFSGGAGQPQLAVGDQIRITRQVDPTGTTTYSFYDYERTWPLVGLAVAFAVVVVAVARWRGLRALIGIVVAFAVLVVFMLPALRDGTAAIPVALVASAMILYAVIYLAHGVSLRTSAALLGTLASLLLAAVLSWAAIELTHLTGLSEEENNAVATYLGNVSITGLLAGRIHRRLTGCAQRRHGHAGVDGLRAGRNRGYVPPGGVRRRDAGGTRPHRQYRLHAGARLRGQRAATAAAVQRRQPLAGRCADE